MLNPRLVGMGRAGRYTLTIRDREGEVLCVLSGDEAPMTGTVWRTGHAYTVEIRDHILEQAMSVRAGRGDSGYNMGSTYLVQGDIHRLDSFHISYEGDTID